MAKILNIVETAYRGTLEEQDDTILWLTRALQSAGAEIGVLLRANAVNYAVRDQDASGLAFGGTKLAHPARPDRDLESMVRKGIPVYFVEEDARERGIAGDRLIAGLKKISRKEIAAVFDEYDKVWHW